MERIIGKKSVLYYKTKKMMSLVLNVNICMQNTSPVKRIMSFYIFLMNNLLTVHV